MKKNLIVAMLCCLSLLFIFSAVVAADDKFYTDKNGVTWIWFNDQVGWVEYDGPTGAPDTDDGAADPTGEKWGSPIEAPPEMTDKDWFYDPLTALIDAGIIKGYEDGTIRPYNKVTRAEFVTMLARLDGVDISKYTSHPFTDASATWYKSYIAWAAAEEIVKGTSPTTFKPNAQISRQEMMTMIARYVEKTYFELPYIGMGDFYDHSKIAPWAVDAIYGLRSLGLAVGAKQKVNGESVMVINPLAIANRAEAGTMLYRIQTYEWGV